MPAVGTRRSSEGTARVEKPPLALARNEVLLVGRVAAAADERQLPSGDVLVAFRLIVDRPAGSSGRPAASRVDTIDCTAWGAGVRRRALRLEPGSVVEVTGSMRRRFWRVGGAAVSRVEVEVIGLRRMRP